MSGFTLLGLVLALMALAFVLYPIFKPSGAPSVVAPVRADLTEHRAALYRQILDLEFDQQLGKLAAADAHELTAAMLRQAAELLARESGVDTHPDAEVEREIRAVRAALAVARETELRPVHP